MNETRGDPDPGALAQLKQKSTYLYEGRSSAGQGRGPPISDLGHPLMTPPPKSVILYVSLNRISRKKFQGSFSSSLIVKSVENPVLFSLHRTSTMYVQIHVYPQGQKYSPDHRICLFVSVVKQIAW